MIAFSTRYVCTMNFRLFVPMNAPVVLMDLMNRVFKPYLDKLSWSLLMTFLSIPCQNKNTKRT